MSNSQIRKQNKQVNIKKDKIQKDMFDMSKGTLGSVFKKIWIPTMVSMLLGGTLVVFDSMFVSLGFGPWGMFSETGLNLSGNAYSALGSGAIATVQPYFLLIAATGIMIGSGTALKMGKAKASGDLNEYQRLLNSFVPKTIMAGVGLGLVLILFAKPLIYLGSGAQSTYMENWNNNPLIQGGGFTDLGGGAWSKFDWDAMNAEFDGVTSSTDFIAIWQSNYSTLTGFDFTNASQAEYVLSQFEKMNLNGSFLAADAVALTMSETSMAAGHVLDQGTRYLQIQGIFGVFFMIASSSAFVLRMEGKAHIATYAGIGMLTTNLVLDLIFVNVLGGNLVGAVLATGIAQVVGSQIVTRYLKTRFPTKVTGMDWTFAKKGFGSTLKMGIPAFALNLATILLQWGTILSMGIVFRDWTSFSILTSGFQGFFSMYTMFFLIASGTIMSITPIASYNQSVGNLQRVRAVRTLGYSIVIGWATLATVLGTFLPHKIALIASKDPGTTYFAMQYSFMAYIGGAITLLNANWLQARGQQKWSTFSSFFKSALIIPVTIGMGYAMKETDVTNWILPMARTAVKPGAGLFLAGPVLDILGGIITSYPLISDFKLLKKQVDDQENQISKESSNPKTIETTKTVETIDISNESDKKIRPMKEPDVKTKETENISELKPPANPKSLTVAELREYAKKIGYKIPVGTKKVSLVTMLESMKAPEELTVAQLKTLAKSLEIKGYSSMRKSELIEAIKSRR